MWIGQEYARRIIAPRKPAAMAVQGGAQGYLRIAAELIAVTFGDGGA